MAQLPVESSGGSGGSPRLLRCYTAPGETFSSDAQMRAHYASEFHRHNLKRKVAGLPPLSREVFEERIARGGGGEGGGVDASSLAPGTRSQARRKRRDEKAVEKAARAAANPRSKAAHWEATREMSEAEYLRHKLKTAAPYHEGCDLFSSHCSEDMHTNLEYMAKTHGFYIPYFDYCKDPKGLLNYLLEKVYVGNVALLSNKQFHSVEAVQAHMKSKSQCRIELEGNEEELGEFYDLEAMAERSPLWQYVEVEEEGEEGWEDAEEGADEPDASACEAEGELDRVLERLLSLGMISEAQMDGITDSIAEGTQREEEALREWKAKLKEARLSDQASTTRSRVTMAVRHRTIGDSEAGSLTLSKAGGGTREIGHRSMKAFYKQSYRPADTSLGVQHPGLERLMLQYSKAGVLTQSTHSDLSGYQQRHKNEISYNTRRIADKKFMQQGLINNTTAKGMKHFKNQSLNF